MSDTIWWCEVHEHSHPYKNPVDPCRMVERRLVSPTALIIDRSNVDAFIGEFALRCLQPKSLIAAEPSAVLAGMLDALASSQGEGETV